MSINDMSINRIHKCRRNDAYFKLVKRAISAEVKVNKVFMLHWTTCSESVYENVSIWVGFFHCRCVTNTLFI